MRNLLAFIMPFVFCVSAEKNDGSETGTNIQISTNYLPYRVELVRDPPLNDSLCRGIIIDKNTILTTASCYTQKGLANIYAYYVKTNTSHFGTGFKKRIKNFMTHEKYNLSIVNNLAVLKIVGEFQRDNALVEVANISKMNSYYSKNKDGDIFVNQGKCMTQRREYPKKDWPKEMEGDPLIDEHNQVVCLYVHYSNFSEKEPVVGVLINPHLKWIKTANETIIRNNLMTIKELSSFIVVTVFLIYSLLSIITSIYYV